MQIQVPHGDQFRGKSDLVHCLPEMGPEAGGQLSLQGIGVSVTEKGSMENLSQNEVRFILLLNITGVP